MTNQWFRSWHGAPTDPKWLGIARKAGVAPGIVAAVVWALLDRASQAEPRGSVAGYDADGIACFMGCDADDVEKIVALLHEKEVLTGDAFTGWEKHQPKREDNSSERVRAYRERHKTAETEPVTQCNAQKHTETLDTDTDTDTEQIQNKAEQKEDRAAACVEIGRRVTDLMGVTNDPRWLGNWSTVSVWLAQGFDAELDILPTVAATVDRLKRTKKPMPGSLKYFSRAIEENHKARKATGESPAQVSAREFYCAKKGTPQHSAWIAHYRKQGRRMAFYESQDMLTVPTEFPPHERAA